MDLRTVIVVLVSVFLGALTYGILPILIGWIDSKLD